VVPACVVNNRFTPGGGPFINMADALVREMPALRLAEMLRARETLPELIEAALADAPDWMETLLFTDQFEELFTLAGKADAEAVAAMLATCAHSRRLCAVVTMRADFYHRAVEYPCSTTPATSPAIWR
jgi:hypothetical protein